MISIISPVHKEYNGFVRDCYDSIMAQTDDNWEWIIVINNGGSCDIQDYRVRIVQGPDETSIGKLKGLAASEATGDVLLELDMDDMLTPGAISEVQDAFKDPEVAMVYSNSASFKHGGDRVEPYSEYYGWKSRPYFHNGIELAEEIAFPCSSQMMRRIEWAPNHVRAWRRNAYESIGGHKDLAFGDDHDLCCRFFLKYGRKGIKHIDKCLYLYRVHESNSCVKYNAEVQEQTAKNYLNYSRDLAVKDARDQQLLTLDLGGRIAAWEGFTTVDLFDADVITNLNNRWPFEDNSVGVIKASHVFEHLINPIHTMNEAYRVLAPGGWMFIDVPSTDGRGAFQDPTHVSFWNENSIWYYTDKNFARFIPGFKGRFQNARTITWYPTDFEKQHDIPCVQADLIAIKGQRCAGEIRI